MCPPHWTKCIVGASCGRPMQSNWKDGRLKRRPLGWFASTAFAASRRASARPRLPRPIRLDAGIKWKWKTDWPPDCLHVCTYRIRIFHPVHHWCCIKLNGSPLNSRIQGTLLSDQFTFSHWWYEISFFFFIHLFTHKPSDCSFLLNLMLTCLEGNILFFSNVCRWLTLSLCFFFVGLFGYQYY